MSNGPEDSTTAADWNVELTAEAADRAEAILRDFATDAELEMAVIVDRSGGMIAGVATRQNVDVSTVGALVAGAFGAMGALANELGEPQVTESLHHGSGDTVYLREIGERFVLLGVTSSDLPSGLVREKGGQIAGPLGAILSGTGEEVVAEEEETASESAAASDLETASESPVEAQPQAAAPVEAEPPSTAEADPVAPAGMAAPPIQTDIFGEPSVPVGQGQTGEATGLPHTEISVEDGHVVSMATLNPVVVAPEPEAPTPEPEAQKDEPDENPNYVFEIG